VVKVITYHENIDQKGRRIKTAFDFSEESDGTQKLFGLAWLWFLCVNGRLILVADELDMRLHPLLTKWLIKQFYVLPDSSIEGNGQLIFMCHDSSLLDKSLFRRDQIWFTERDARGASSLFSLWDFKEGKPRKAENLARGYLAGRYGAIPILEDLANGR
jgi:hypothetical protein